MIPVRDCVQIKKDAQIVLLNFPLHYEWFKFYNPLLFSLHPTSLSNWKSQLVLTCLRDNPAISEGTPASDPADTVRWLSLSKLLADHCWVTHGSPTIVPWGDRLFSVQPPVVFYRQLHPKFWTVSNQVTEQTPAGLLQRVNLFGHLPITEQILTPS